MKRRGRKFAESDAFFGGAGRGADKFRILPCAKLSASSVVAPQGESECCQPLKGSFGILVLFFNAEARSCAGEGLRGLKQVSSRLAVEILPGCEAHSRSLRVSPRLRVKRRRHYQNASATADERLW